MIEDPKRQSMSYNKWLDSWAGFSYWEEVRILIDEVLEKNPHTNASFLYIIKHPC